MNIPEIIGWVAITLAAACALAMIWWKVGDVIYQHTKPGRWLYSKMPNSYTEPAPWHVLTLMGILGGPLAWIDAGKVYRAQKVKRSGSLARAAGK